MKWLKDKSTQFYQLLFTFGPVVAFVVTVLLVELVHWAVSR